MREIKVSPELRIKFIEIPLVGNAEIKTERDKLLLKELFQEIIPVMSSAGITVESYWVNEEQTQFIWIRSYGTEKESIAIAEKKFYGSAWWKENVDIVRGHIAHREFKIINSV